MHPGGLFGGFLLVGQALISGQRLHCKTKGESESEKVKVLGVADTSFPTDLEHSLLSVKPAAPLPSAS